MDTTLLVERTSMICIQLVVLQEQEMYGRQETCWSLLDGDVFSRKVVSSTRTTPPSNPAALEPSRTAEFLSKRQSLRVVARLSEYTAGSRAAMLVENVLLVTS